MGSLPLVLGLFQNETQRLFPSILFHLLKKQQLQESTQLLKQSELILSLDQDSLSQSLEMISAPLVL